MKNILVDAVHTFVSPNGAIFQDLFVLLEKYPHRKIILTNANNEELEKFGLLNVPYEVFTLKHNPNKIDPEYFKEMLKHFSLDKDDVVYFEHNKGAVKAAQSVGIVTYHYDNEKKDLKNLKIFLDKNLY